MFEIGMSVRHRGLLHVVVGFTPMSVEPGLLELEDVQSGRIRLVELTEPDLKVEPGGRAQLRQNEARDEADTL